MTQYSEQVEMHRARLAAIAWGKVVKDVHAFNSDDLNMWYDKDPDENGKRDGRVVDTRFNNGKIVRRISTTGKEYILCKAEDKKSLLNTYLSADDGWKTFKRD